MFLLPFFFFFFSLLVPDQGGFRIDHSRDFFGSQSYSSTHLDYLWLSRDRGSLAPGAFPPLFSISSHNSFLTHLLSGPCRPPEACLGIRLIDDPLKTRAYVFLEGGRHPGRVGFKRKSPPFVPSSFPCSRPGGFRHNAPNPMFFFFRTESGLLGYLFFFQFSDFRYPSFSWFSLIVACIVFPPLEVFLLSPPVFR